METKKKVHSRVLWPLKERGAVDPCPWSLQRISSSCFLSVLFCFVVLLFCCFVVLLFCCFFCLYKREESAESGEDESKGAAVRDRGQGGGQTRDQRAIKERREERERREEEKGGKFSCFVVFEGFDDAGNHLMGDSGLGALCVVKSDLELGEGCDNAIVVVCL